MTKDELREKAHALPYAPGVYIMMDKTGQVIYVGKAKQLKNRVSQYFQDSASHSAKTVMMVSKINSFDVILAESEFEALVLECSLIKRHMPKYNILLKDDKGYPFIRVDLRDEYPTFTIASKIAGDGAKYFGPYGGRGTTNRAIHAIELAERLPTCGKKFPRDIGRERPCLNFHMGSCDAFCRSADMAEEYRTRVHQAVMILEGRHERVAEDIRAAMEEAAENLEFERAAELRDRLRAVESLGQRQRVVSGAMADTDAVGYYEGDAKSCFTVLHYIGGSLLDKDYEIITDAEGGLEEAVSSLTKQYYQTRGAAPKRILLPCYMEDGELLARMLSEQLGHSVKIFTPQRGDNLALVQLANRNAREETERVTTAQERVNKTLELLGNTLGLTTTPQRIESYDISNISGTDTVGSMVVFVDGKPKKKDYKRFKIKDVDGQDDYQSMRQMLTRRFTHIIEGDSAFGQTPDLILIDGGQGHAAAIQAVADEMGITIPIFGMVKDDRHRTRALVTPQGAERGIKATPVLFALIGKIQEETHRFAIEYHRELRDKRVKQSQLDKINGVGPARRAALIKHFKSVAAIKSAGVDELSAIVPKSTAQAVFDHFHKEETS